jgi:putative FmdB family regulatory protein
MPIYEYQCGRCHSHFEQLLLSTDETVACPQCESHAVKRQLSVFSSPGERGEVAGEGGGCGCSPATCGCR